MPELFTVDEVAKLLRIKSETKVLELMNRHKLRYLEGIAKGRLVYSEHFWQWVEEHSLTADEHADESKDE